MIKLSIVIPTKNSPETLFDLLKSLSNQTYAHNLEVIIVHNVEKTFIENKFSQFKEAFPNFIYTCSYQLGVNTARNVGLRQVTSPIVWFLDDDCYLSQSDIAERLLEKHAFNSDVSGIGGGYKLSEKDINIYTKMYHKIAMQWLSNSKDLKGKQLYLIGGNASYKMRDIQHSFDEYIPFGGSELSFNRRLIILNKTILLDPELDVEHRNSINLLEYVNKAYLQGKGHYHNFKNLSHSQSDGKIGLRQEELNFNEKLVYETYRYFFYLGFFNRKNKNKSKLHYLTSFYQSLISTFFYELFGKYLSKLYWSTSKPIFILLKILKMPFIFLTSNLWKIKIPLHFLKSHFWKIKMPLYFLHINIWKAKLPIYFINSNFWKIKKPLYFLSSNFWKIKKPLYFISSNFWKIKKPLYFLSKNFWKIKKPLYFISLNFWKLKIPYYFISRNLWRLKLPFYKIYYCGEYHVKTYLLLGFLRNKKE